MQFDQKTLIKVNCFVEIHGFQLTLDRVLLGCRPSHREVGGKAAMPAWGQHHRQIPRKWAASSSLWALVSEVCARGSATSRQENLEYPDWS